MGFSSCGVWVQLLQGMWNLPRPWIEPMSPELAGRLLTTGSPRKSLLKSLLKKISLRCRAHQIIQNDLSWKSSVFPGRSVGKESACNARDHGSIPGSGRSTGEGIGYPLRYSWASLVTQLVKKMPAMRETWVRSLGWEDSLEKGTATHSNILAWRSPCRRRVRHD